MGGLRILMLNKFTNIVRMRIMLVLMAMFSFCVKAEAQSGNVFAEYMEAWNLFIDGDDYNDNKKLVQSFEKMKAVAQKGFPPAQYELARDYDGGVGCSVDFVEAFKWMKTCADNPEWNSFYAHKLNGEPPTERSFSRGSAYFMLGTYYMSGIGVTENMEQAISCWQKGKDYSGALQGTCYLQLAFGYEKGWGNLPVDYKKAVEMFKKGTDFGDPDAPFYLSIYYANGEGGLPQSDADAFHYTRLSAQRGYAKAMFAMGSILEFGWFGQSRDMKQAIQWYIKAAKKHNSEAMIRLSELGINNW